MNISEDILRYNLQNAYFLIGTACGGKTTMADAIAKKHGFIHFNDNYHEDNFAGWERIRGERQREDEQAYDWEKHFNRPPREYNESLDKDYREYTEYAILEIIKLAQENTVVVDMGLPGALAAQIAPYNRVACLLAPPELVVRDYFDRDDHRDIYEAIMRLKDPEKALRNMENVFREGTQATIDEARASGLFCVMRGEDSTVEGTLRLLERHFGL